jgi:hypothetical protein
MGAQVALEIQTQGGSGVLGTTAVQKKCQKKNIAAYT